MLLTWNEYVGRAVPEYRVQRSLNGGAYTDLASVPAGAGQLTYTAAGVGRDGFNQTFRVIAATRASVGESFSNEARATFQNAVQTYNIITPDGDGKNDRFVIDNATLYPDNELVVYNRWGREVYRRKNYDNSWDGGEQAAGTYYFLFTANGQSFKSWLEIVK